MTNKRDKSQDSDNASPTQGASGTNIFRGFLPNALAKEERIVRLKETRLRRRNGNELTAEEIRNDLLKLLTHLMTQLSAHIAGISVILKLPAQALLYAERTATYAIHDYPRAYQNDRAIKDVWDVLECIYMVSAYRRKEGAKGDARAVILSLHHIVRTAIRVLHPSVDEDARAAN